MSLSWKIGRVAGIDLFLHSTFLLLLAFVGATSQDGLLAVMLMSSVFGCVLLHELGHALTARQFGIQTIDITLYPIGGVARLERMPRAPGAELLIALAGPMVNVAIVVGLVAFQMFVAPLLFWEVGSLGAAFVSALITINMALALFNMIPAFPMDGGRVLRAVLSGWLGRPRATEVAANLGQLLAVLFALYALFNGTMLQVVLAAFIFLAARSELAQVKAEERRRQPPHRDGHGDGGVWFAPPGHVWVDRGQGVWQLVPVTVPTSHQARSWN